MKSNIFFLSLILLCGSYIYCADGTPLISACCAGREDLVRLLLSERADFNVIGQCGMTPLCIASSKGHEGIVRRLLHAKADINLADTDGETPLYVASCQGHEGIVTCFINAGAEVDLADTNGETPLYTAVYNNHKKIVKLLVEAKADLDRVTQEGEAALHVASREDYEEIVWLLLEGTRYSVTKDELQASGVRHSHTTFYTTQADVDLFNKSGQTALCMALQHNNQRVINELILRKADFDITTDEPCRLLNSVICNTHPLIRTQVIRALIENYGRQLPDDTPIEVIQEQFKAFVQRGLSLAVKKGDRGDVIIILQQLLDDKKMQLFDDRKSD